MTENNPLTEETSIVALGASARALAWSAMRAGFSPWTLDLFQDLDLARFSPGLKFIQGRPGNILKQLKQAPAGPLVYTGGLENQPRLLKRIQKSRPVWGITGDCLKKLRDPYGNKLSLEQAGLLAPQRLHLSQNPTDSCQWLVKPKRHAGGNEITPRPHSLHSTLQSENEFFLEEWIEGESRSAVFLLGASRAELLGVTCQMTGWGCFHASTFQYSGSIGPVEPLANEKADLLWLGKILSVEMGGRGLVGVDYVLRQGRAVVIEINPRYSASVEILEWSSGKPYFLLHAREFSQVNAIPSGFSKVQGILGKGIYFAPQDLVFPETGPWESGSSPFEFPAFADIPWPGVCHQAGAPVITAFARGQSVAEVRNILEKTAQELDNCFFPNGTVLR